MNELALYAGAGGGILGGLLCGFRTVAAVEIDRHARSTLLQRQRDGVLAKFPIWDDARTFNGVPFRGLVSVVSAGFPCQPFSFAGKQKAEADERNGWPDTIRIIREVRPALAFLENVPGLLSRRHGYFGTVLGDLAAAGFNAEWGVLGASDVGARHRRKRLWMLAYSVRNGARERLAELHRQAEKDTQGQRRRLWNQSSQSRRDGSDSDSEFIRKQFGRPESGPQTTIARVARQVEARREAQSGLDRMVDVLAGRLDTPWGNEPGDLPRVAANVPDRVARLRAIGNGQVPLCAAIAFEQLRQRVSEALR